jgi:hypothetical protein
MDCPKVQEWLLQSDLSDAEAAPAEIAAHLAGCQACQRFTERLRRLETAVREMPIPDGADAGREAFLGRLGRLNLAPRSRRIVRWRRVAGWVAAAAAAVLLAAGLGLLLVYPGGVKTAEASEVLDRLVDWNIELAEARSLDDRGRLYAAAAEKFDRQTRQGNWSAEDSELAGRLLENGVRLVRDDDPLAEAEGFTDLATVLVRHMGAAASKHDERAMQRLTRYYAHVMQRGVNAKVERFASGGNAAADRARKLEKLLSRHAELREQVKQFLEDEPDASFKDVRRALDLPPPRHRGKDK